MSNTNLQTVIGMLRRAHEFDKLPTPQQAALRAQVSRMSKTAADPQIADVLSQIKAFIGEADTRRETGGMTIEDLADEYRAGYTAYDPPRRAAFKSRLTRVRKAAELDGDADAVARASALADEIEAAEQSEARDEIRRLTEALRKGDAI